MVLTDSWQTWIGCLPGADGPCAPGVADWLVLLAVAAGLVAAVGAGRRAVDVLLTLRATAWSAILARRLSRLVKSRDYDAAAFFDADGAGSRGRRAGRGARPAGAAPECPVSADDRLVRRDPQELLRPPLHRRHARPAGVRAGSCASSSTCASVVTASDGPRLRDLDGHWTLDVGGSYGVNVAGFDALQGVDVDRAWTGYATSGPVLGPLHPLVAENVDAPEAPSPAWTRCRST